MYQITMEILYELVILNILIVLVIINDRYNIWEYMEVTNEIVVWRMLQHTTNKNGTSFIQTSVLHQDSNYVAASLRSYRW